MIINGHQNPPPAGRMEPDSAAFITLSVIGRLLARPDVLTRGQAYFRSFVVIGEKKRKAPMDGGLSEMETICFHRSRDQMGGPWRSHSPVADRPGTLHPHFTGNAGGMCHGWGSRAQSAMKPLFLLPLVVLLAQCSISPSAGTAPSGSGRPQIINVSSYDPKERQREGRGYT